MRIKQGDAPCLLKLEKIESTVRVDHFASRPILGAT